MIYPSNSEMGFYVSPKQWPSSEMGFYTSPKILAELRDGVLRLPKKWPFYASSSEMGFYVSPKNGPRSEMGFYFSPKNGRAPRWGSTSPPKMAELRDGVLLLATNYVVTGVYRKPHPAVTAAMTTCAAAPLRPLEPISPKPPTTRN